VEERATSGEGYWRRRLLRGAASFFLPLLHVCMEERVGVRRSA